MIARRFVVAIACLVVVAGAAGCHKVVSIAFVQKTAVTIDDDKGVAVPVVVALDADGNNLEQGPPVVVSAVPSGIVSVENGKVMPLANGDAKLIAASEGLPPVELPVHVAIVDDVRVVCPAPCSIHVGESIALDASGTGLGKKIDKGIQFTSSDAAKATVGADGRVLGVSPGEAVITGVLGKKKAEVKVEVHAAVDELRVLCPWPPIVVVVKHGADGNKDAGERSCEVLEGDDVHIDAVAVSKGDAITGDRIDWKSSDPSVRVVAGVATADHAGGAMIEVHVADLTAELPVSVVKGKGLGYGHCSEGEGAYTNHFDINVVMHHGTEETKQGFLYRCESPAAKRCLDDAVKTVIASVEPLPFKPKDASTFAASALDERGRRCCCKR